MTELLTLAATCDLLLQLQSGSFQGYTGPLKKLSLPPNFEDSPVRNLLFGCIPLEPLLFWLLVDFGGKSEAP